ncbi:MAG: glutamine synthetase family protein [Paracoccaceae bacterium]|nr:glutamine synthetase family protein [Paracoccaceae bacterium]
MAAQLSFEDLKENVATGVIDTVLVCMIDMQGRLMGKRFHAASFVEHAHDETHCCNYLLATDLEMGTPDGYASTNWAAGYGDYVMKPDMDTLRQVAWLEGTAMVLCDILDHHTHEEVPHAPRAMLKRQIARAAAMGLVPMAATELEFFLFEGTYDAVRKSGYALTPVSGYNEDYHILQTTKEENVLRTVRNALFASGVPVENTKGEAETGQEELNIRYADAMACADHHVIAKQATKEIGWAQGVSVSYLAKWHKARVGSAAHIHQSLWTPEGDPAFYDKGGDYAMSGTLRAYLAGLLKYTADTTFFLAPYINSYKRFAKGTFAPTKVAWSVDNRTAGYRLVGDGTKGVRVECRIPGADVNPYLALAAQLAAGLQGIEEGLDLEPPATGDLYDSDAEELPSTLRGATEALRGSSMLKAAFGEEVVAHYVRCAEVEQEEFDRAVTDYEIARGFERA